MLLAVSLAALGALIYGWRYFWHILKNVPLTLYTLTISLVILQYIGENEIGFSHDTGVVVEEVSEMLIYCIAFAYLVRFNLSEFDSKLRSKLNQNIFNKGSSNQSTSNQSTSKETDTEDAEVSTVNPEHVI